MDLKDFASSLVAENSFIKASFAGFAGSGKTRTATEFIIGCCKKMEITKPVLIIDNEKGSRFLVPIFRQAGITAIVKETVTLADVLESFKFLNRGEIGFLFIDSLTKVWYQFVRDYKTANKKTFMTLQDWGKILPDWQEKFADVFVSLVGNCVFTGRGGFQYEMEENEETHKKEFVKSGVKMKMAGETPFEPDLNIWMEMDQDYNPQTGKNRVFRRGTIMKDRSGLIDGKVFENPTFKHFEPVVNFLLSVEKGNVSKTSDSSNLAAFESYNDRKVLKTTMLEEVQNALVKKWPSTSAAEKQAKIKAIEEAFGTNSWTAIENMHVDKVSIGHAKIMAMFKVEDPDPNSPEGKVFSAELDAMAANQ
jgi:hypothetical protein